MNRLFLCYLLLFYWGLSAQYYQLPVDIPIQLSGTFAELRGTHLHAGVDIKTQGKEGFELKAVADGYVSRIKIQQGGYGKALYIHHPNGTTSVYAHLQRYGQQIVPHVRKKQYASKSYTIEFFPDPDLIPIKKGDIIGYSGNTGSSLGPHLHFELRSSANQIPFNPMLGGIDVKDSRRPEIQQLMGFPIDGIMNHSEQKIQLPIAQKNDSTFVTDPVFALGTIGFGIEHFDRQDESYNKNGTFEISASVNGNPTFHVRFDTLSFDDTSHMHKLVDYPHYVDTNKNIMRLFDPFEETVPFVNFTQKGVLFIEEGKNYTYEIKLNDIAGNNTYVLIPIVGMKEDVWLPKNTRYEGKMIQPYRDYLFEFEKTELYFQAHTFSTPTPLDIRADADSIFIENPHAYFNKPYSLTWKKGHVEKGAYLALKQNDKWAFIGTQNKEDHFSYKLKKTGVFTVLHDTIPPTIVDQKKIDNRWISLEKDIRFTIDDNETGINRFEGYLNGEWILFEYEQKKKELTFRFKDPVMLSSVKHNLKLIVWDNVGNNTTFETTFYRKE